MLNWTRPDRKVKPSVLRRTLSAVFSFASVLFCSSVFIRLLTTRTFNSSTRMQPEFRHRVRLFLNSDYVSVYKLNVWRDVPHISGDRSSVTFRRPSTMPNPQRLVSDGPRLRLGRSYLSRRKPGRSGSPTGPQSYDLSVSTFFNGGDWYIGGIARVSAISVSPNGTVSISAALLYFSRRLLWAFFSSERYCVRTDDRFQSRFTFRIPHPREGRASAAPTPRRPRVTVYGFNRALPFPGPPSFPMRELSERGWFHDTRKRFADDTPCAVHNSCRGTLRGKEPEQQQTVENNSIVFLCRTVCCIACRRFPTRTAVYTRYCFSTCPPRPFYIRHGRRQYCSALDDSGNRVVFVRYRALWGGGYYKPCNVRFMTLKIAAIIAIPQRVAFSNRSFRTESADEKRLKFISNA